MLHKIELSGFAIKRMLIFTNGVKALMLVACCVNYISSTFLLDIRLLRFENVIRGFDPESWGAGCGLHEL